MTQSTSYLSTLAQHAIFGLPTDPSSSQPTPLPALSGPRQRVLLRGSDLILAVGSEIRIASLSDAKARFDSSSDQLGDDYDIGHYKTLKSTTLNFEIHQLVLNPTGKLLAVVGKNEVAVVVLPRKGWASAYGNQIECRSLSVGRYYHSLPGSPPVASVVWHPWGDEASSLLVLTTDSLLREYNIADDAQEPAQTLSFITASPKPAASATRRGFSADDEEGEKAVGMVIGGGGGWGPLTVMGLMRNGDVRAICPFLPSKAAIPSAYISHLSTYVTAKVEALPATINNTFNGDHSSALTPYRTPSRSFAASSNGTPRHDSGLPTNYALQLQYIHHLARHASTLPDPDDEDDATTDRPVRVTGGTTLGRAGPVAPQGPFLLQPAPPALDNGAADEAADLAYISYEAEPGADPLGVVVVAFEDGRVDLCLEVEKVEARWVAGGEPAFEDLPALAMYESVDLGIAADLPADKVADGLDNLGPTVTVDPLYPDTVYVHHSRGAHCLMLGGWLSAVALSAAGGSAVEVERALKEATPTESVWVVKTGAGSDLDAPAVIGLGVVHDVYLGYSLLLVTSALQLVGFDLALRVDTDVLGAMPDGTAHAGEGAYKSLLAEPFAVPKALSAKAQLPKMPPTLAAKPLAVNPESLRFLGSTVEGFRGSLRDLASAADAVQHRLEMVLLELGQQLKEIEELASEGDALRSTGTDLATRLETAAATQATLLARADRVLQRLMDAHQPTLSAHETKWFAELKRLERTVATAGEGSLVERARRLEGQVEALKPGLVEMKRREREKEEAGRVQASGEVHRVEGRLGGEQLRALEGRLADEGKLLAEARRRVERITAAMRTASLG